MDMVAIIFCVIIGIILLMEGFLLYKKERKRKIVESLPWFNRIIPPQIELLLTKNKKRRPESIIVTVKNKKQRSIDLVEMDIQFSKWFKKRTFRINKIKQQTIFPLLISKNNSVEIPVHLLSFYNSHKDLKHFESLVVILKERGGSSFKSKKISLWRF